MKEKHSHNYDACSHIASTLDQLQQHVETCLPSIQKCSYCETNVTSQEALTKHMNDAHRFKSHLCSIVLPSQDSMKNHVNEAHTIISFKCSNCDIIFETRDDIKRHNLREHQQICSECNITFQTTTALQDHITSNHSFPFEYCDTVMKIRELPNTPY